MKFRFLACAALAGCASAPTPAPTPLPAPEYDLVIRNGLIVDGSGGVPHLGGVAVSGARVALLGNVDGLHGKQEIDAHGQVIAPGFINLLSWSNESLIQDGRSLSELKQGVTLEVMGEGFSMGPLTDAMKKELRDLQTDVHYDVTWTTLAEYLDQLVAHGISTNVASLVGAATVREHELGNADRAPTPAELARMQTLVRDAMRDGALGVGSALIYAPGVYAKTDEITALVAAAAESGGGYMSHMRSEGDRFLEALDELIVIARATGAHAEVFHMKAAGKSNWPKMQQAVTRIEAARKSGLSVSANMYTYTAGATGLDASMPPWVQEGGLDAWVARLKDKKIRKRVLREMRTRGGGWENLYLAAGSADNLLLVGFREEKLKPLTGKTLAQVAAMRKTTPEDTIIDLVIEDRSRVGTVYFLMSEDNVKLGLAQPWVALGSDEASQAPEGPFLKSNPHPRAYGNFARFLGKYVREEKVANLPEAIRRMTQLPAQNWKLEHRGCIAAGCYADIVVFDPATIVDHATFEKPAQFATGVSEVVVNGVPVLRGGEHTGAKPGQVVHGPGWQGGKK